MDSDDEYERRPRGRDKFRRERSDYQERSEGRRENNRSGGGGGNRRDDSWQDNRRGRQQQWDNNPRRNRDNYGGGGGRHHEGAGPPMKRQRRDWDNSGYSNQQGGDYGGYSNQNANQWGVPADTQQHSFNNQQQAEATAGPRMLSFKQFLNSQADDIEDMEAVRKYQEYKLEFRKTQIADFFTSHKDEEWFRNKYNPSESLAYQSKLNQAVKKRASVFVDLFQSGWFDRFTLTAEQGEEITKLLDAAVIKFEGGTDFDLQVLNEKAKRAELQANQESQSNEAKPQTDNAVQQDSSTDKGVNPVSPTSVPLPETPAPASEPLKSDKEGKPGDVPDPASEQVKVNEDQQQEGQDGKSRKRKHRHRDAYYNDDNGESESESDSEIEPPPAGGESSKEGNQSAPKVEAISTDDVISKEAGEEVKTVDEKTSDDGQEKKPSESEQPGSEIPSDDVTETTPEVAESAQTADMKLEQSTGSTPVTNNKQGDEKIENMDTTENVEKKGDNNEEDGAEEENAEPEITTPRALHLTVSLFVRNVPPKISHYDLDSLCTRYPGYMRVVLSDPAPEKKFTRRGWITFKPDVNIKDICWSLNNIKLKDVELNPMVNRELAKRVRTVSGAAVLKGWVESDITMATKLILQLDEKFEVWKQEVKLEEKKVEEVKQDETTDENNEKSEESNEKPSENEESPSKVVSKINMPQSNPVLDSIPSNISEKLASKSTADNPGVIPEFETSEGNKVPGLDGSEHPPPEIDENLVKLLDKLLLYLRIVHSLDYYSGAEYLYEDDMPNRCGIIHIRSPLPDKVNYEEVTEWHKNLHQKLDQHLQKKETLSEEEAVKLGKKDQEQEVEKFIQANTQELAKDKWLCPLSGKKFRGPEFVQKHIFNKHGDKVEEVKSEVTFFNNFVYDPNRPSEVGVKPISSTTPVQQGFQGGMQQQSGGHGNTGGWGRGGMHYSNRGGYNNQYGGSFRSDHYNNRGGFQKPRRGSFSGGGGPRHDPRPIVQYRDLDAPGDDSEFF
ncbi:serrate RNA effector molecule homolog isoform X2 [Dendronephthya gigantea]|uniref:serrate RNA effector molecule homolog isoform X2 n=1 Tax=Dendronephthya gigantea TaxID=151771 RepID=UPI00106B9A32|nr:serrate RNA effector molecule homolog isoform X2 [Dendronephthya gigantea]